MASDGKGETNREIGEKAKTRGIKVKMVHKANLERIAPGQVHQGLAAYYFPPAFLDIKDLIESVRTKDTASLVALDGVEDPRNLGAVIRTAEALGASGVIIPSRRTARITPAAVKSSAGAALKLPIMQVSNMDQAIRELKSGNFWVYGLEAGADRTIWEEKLTGRIVLVMGGEGKGLAKLTRERCDGLLSIPQKGTVASLNVSVAAAIALAEWVRQSQ